MQGQDQEHRDDGERTDQKNDPVPTVAAKKYAVGPAAGDAVTRKKPRSKQDQAEDQHKDMAGECHQSTSKKHGDSQKQQACARKLLGQLAKGVGAP